MTEFDAVVRKALDSAGVAYDRYSTLELVRGDPSGDVRALLVFVDGEREPRVFVKLDAGAERATLETEYRNLRTLQRVGSPTLRSSVPVPLLLDRHDAFHVLAQTALPGQRMKDFAPAAYFASRRFADHFDAVIEWLSDFARSMGTELGDDRLDVRGEVDAFRREFRRSDALDGLIDESVAALEPDPPAAVPRHGDFCTANVLVAKSDRIRVIDWELPMRGGWPLADLLYFASSVWCVPYGSGPDIREANYNRLFFESTPLTEALVGGVHRFARGQRIAPDQLVPLSVLAWISAANHKRRALGDDGPLTDELSAANFPLVIVRAGHCRNLELIAERRDRYLGGAR